MRIGITGSSYYIEGKKETDYEQMKRDGYNCCDYQGLTDTTGELYNADDAEFAKMLFTEKKKAEAAGIEFSQVHAPWPTDDTSERSRIKRLEYMKKAVRGTSILDGKYLVIHPIMPNHDFEEDPDLTEKLNEEFFREICTYAKPYNVGICMENMPMTELRLSSVKKTAEFVKRLDLTNFFICLDTGHANIFGDDCGEDVRLCDGRLKVLHVHDNNGLTDEHILPYLGTIDWASFKSALSDTSFGGVISMELSASKMPLKDLQRKFLKLISDTAKYLAE